MKTVAVLGAAYGGTRAAQVLSQELPEGWRVVLIDRNTHFNHLYVLPRYAILPQHAPKAFIPYTNIFHGPSASKSEDVPNPQRNILLHAQVTSLSEHSLTLSRSFPEHGIDEELHFDYAVYALGSHLPAPINLWGPIADDEGPIANCGTKAGGIEWLRRYHAVIEKAPSVLIVGGGALGIQYATDIAEVYPNKPVTLLHSRNKLLPRFDDAMHEEILVALESLHVKAILGDRLDMSSLNESSAEKHEHTIKTVRTQSGREISAGIVLLCTGQTPNTALLKSLLPESIVPDGPSKGMVRVKRTLQVAIPHSKLVTQAPDNIRTSVSRRATEGDVPQVNDNLEEEQEETDDDDDDDDLSVAFPHLFAIGDAADAFGAINAGHTAYYQGEVAARNIIQLIRASGSRVKLQRYRPGAPAIKISLGLTKSLYQVDGVVGKKAGVSDDLDAPLMWKFCGVDTDEQGMNE